MQRFLPRFTAIAALAFLAAQPAQVEAAESYANCTGFIDSVPAVIATQGVWCLRADLSTAVDSGTAILINTNNVTIDCNDFKLGGLAAGPATLAIGIRGNNRRNATVRNCAIRGFNEGIVLSGAETGGNLIENNRLDGNRAYGIRIQGDGTSMVRANRVLDTGGNPTATFLAGILASGDIIGNTVDGVASSNSGATVRGISLAGAGTSGLVASDNRVRSLSTPANGIILGISVSGQGAKVFDNQVVTNTSDPVHTGIFSQSDNPGFLGRNRVSGFNRPYFGEFENAGVNYSN